MAEPKLTQRYKELPEIIKEVSFIADVLIYWEEDNDFSRFIDGNIGVLGYWLWDVRDNVQALLDKIEARQEMPKIGNDLEQPEGGEETAANSESPFTDPRFWKYATQVDNPTDVLETWLKEHNPEFLEND